MTSPSTTTFEPVDQSGPFTHLEFLYTFASSGTRFRTRAPRLLDLCCGTGRTARVFAANGWDVSAVDTCTSFGDRWALIKESYPSCDFALSDPLKALTTAAGIYDVVLAFDEAVLDLTDPDHLGLVLQHVWRALHEDGLFVFQLEHTDSSPGRSQEAAHAAGFRECWRTSAADPGVPINDKVTHQGTRELFVARR